MSIPTNVASTLTQNAPLFAVLGDQTRLALLLQLGEGGLCSITQLAEGRPQSRQAIRKHLQILEGVRLISGIRRGANTSFRLNPKQSSSQPSRWLQFHASGMMRC